MSTITENKSGEARVWISQPGGHSNCYSDPQGRFVIVAAGDREARDYLHSNAYSAAVAFVEGEFDVHGDIFEAIRHFSEQAHTSAGQYVFSTLAALWHLRTRFTFGRADVKRSIGFHYDLSNQFYEQFLDSRMVYSAADFERPTDSLEKAQAQKLDQICTDLDLRPTDRFLDIGCGWGGLICTAARKYGARSLGCTLSSQQLEFASEALRSEGLEEIAEIRFCDFRDVTGRFDKVASVGMFEHVGRTRLRSYFERVYEMIEPGGLFLNRGAVRLPGIWDAPETLFLQRRVFPDGDLVHLDDVVREGERAGFDVVGVRDLRLQYARTCRCWVENLQRNADRCRALVGNAAYRTWLLYLAASAVSFERRHTGASQVLFSRAA